MKNIDVVAGLKPELLWKHFANISDIPRESKNETEVMNYIKKFAGENQLEYAQDEAGNVVIYKKAHPGYENYPGVVLQGHTDMVCEKNRDTTHDFEKDPLQLIREGKFVRANGTTLGADNGIGVCAALAVLEDENIEHGAIEALFTIDEETGLTGAFNLDSKLLHHRIMLNMDSEEDAAVYVGCAGGKDTVGYFKKEKETVQSGSKAYKIEISGLKGGHSGLDINLGLANAIRLLSRVLKDLIENNDFRLSQIQGGSKRNAIPREAQATAVFAGDSSSLLNNTAEKWNKVLKDEFGAVEPNLNLVVEEAELPKEQFSAVLTRTIVDAIFIMPHGVISMSQSIPGLVETSTNLATVVDTENDIVIGTSQRSSTGTAIDDIALRIKTVFDNLNAEVKVGDAYPGWKPNMDSKILHIATASMEKLNGQKPEIKAIHAGLECGIIGEKFPGMDMASFGPTIHGAHSPDEKVEIDAVERFWSYLLDILKSVNQA